MIGNSILISRIEQLFLSITRFAFEVRKFRTLSSKGKFLVYYGSEVSREFL